jgi:type I restriction enzyme M protein
MRVFSLRIPGYKRSRGVFDEPIKISSIALSKVAELFSKYSFSSSAIDIKARAFQNVYRPASRAGMGQYFTPVNVIKFIVNAVKPNHDDLIIDPFCGSAHFLTESINAVRQLKCSEKLLTDFVYYKLHGIEKSERMVRVAMTDMRLHGDGHSNIRCTDALLPFENYHDIEPNSFDIVMTNPPFGSILSSEAINYLGEFELNNKKSTPLEILGLERCVQLLRDGGKLAIVLPESIFVNKTFAHVRRWLYDNTWIRAIVSLPIETFAPYGTNIKTSILFCTKSSNKYSVDSKVFTGGIENIGYDANGKPSNNEDWNDLLEELNEFLLKEGW